MASDSMVNRSTSSHQALYHLATGHYISSALCLAAKVGIADLLKSGPLGIAALAQATGMHAPSLNRMMHLLVSVGVFDEVDKETYGLTPLGDVLRDDAPGTMRTAVMVFAGTAVQDNWRDLEYCVKTGRPAFAKRGGSTPFVTTEKFPDQASQFDNGLTHLTKRAADAVCAVYDFIPHRLIVDVGGGIGVFLTEILKQNPELRGIIYDQPSVASRASRVIARAGLRERCQALEGDFFNAVPSGGDTYLLKDVVHDWDEEQAAKILSSCSRAMQASSRLLVIEDIYPSRFEHSTESRDAAANDMNMLVSFGGKQRSIEGFRSLFARSNLTLSRIVRTDTRLSIIEGTLSQGF